MNRPDLRRKLAKVGYRSERFSQYENPTLDMLIVPKDESEQRTAYTRICIYHYTDGYAVHNNLEFIQMGIKDIDTAVDVAVEYLSKR